MKKYSYVLALFMLLITINTKAQVGIGTTSPNANAMLDVDVSSLATDAKKGFMPPRMSTSEKNTNIMNLIFWLGKS